VSERKQSSNQAAKRLNKKKKAVSKSASKAEKSKTSEEKKSSKKSAKQVRKATPKKAVKKSSSKARSMEDLLKKTGYTLRAPHRGRQVKGVVTDISKRLVLIDIGAKTEGMVVDREYEAARDFIKGLSVGDTVEAQVVSPENERGQIILSFRKAAQTKSWELYGQHLETGETVVVQGVEVNRGGLIVNAGAMRGFIPSSQFGKKLMGQIDELVGRPVKVKVIEVDRDKNRLIFSERHVSEAEVIKKKEEALKAVTPGDVLEGMVSGIMPFGVFVKVNVPLAKAKGKKGKKKGAKQEEVGELEGLVHISEISWEKVEDPNAHFRVGDRLKVKVLGVNQEAGKLNLSIKQLSDDPWEGIEKRYVVGSKHKGKVTRVVPFGAFVNFEPGIDGLIHISKIPSGEEPKVGEKIDVFVETLDVEQRRMSLALMLKSTEKIIYK
jgi:small subunit ribosomal protein S1